MCFTDDDNLAGVLRSIRVHGMGANKYDNVRIGINGRLDTLQAAILTAKFQLFPEEVELRRAVAARYGHALQQGPGSSRLLTLQTIPPEMTSVWAQYSLLASEPQHRSAILKSLKEAEIPSAIYYPIPLHLQRAFAHLGYKDGDFPAAEGHSKRILSIPMHPYLTEEEQAEVVKAVKVG
jgi:dTDP-4-amino-4,6-dideoxygalactose transaminase